MIQRVFTVFNLLSWRANSGVFLMKSAMILAVLLQATVAIAVDVRTPTYESPPKFYRDQGAVKGLCIDVLKAIENVVPDIRFSVEYGVPLRRVQVGTIDGVYDLLLCATPTSERIDRMVMIDIPVYETRDVLIVRADDPLNDATLDDIRALSSNNIVMTYKGAGQETWMSGQKGLVHDNGASTVEAVFRKLEARRGRFVFCGEAVAANMMSQARFAGKFRVLPTPVRNAGRYFFFSKKTPSQTVGRVQSALLKLWADGELARIARRYVLE